MSLNDRILEENWDDITAKVLKPLWNTKFKSMYESLKLDYSDFESMSGLELTKAFRNFQSDKSGIYTFATTVITRKAKSELRNFGSRNGKKTLSEAVSLESTVCGGSDMTIGDTIATQETDKDEIGELTQRYLDSLTKTQREVALLFMEGFKEKKIKKMLGLSNDRYKLIIMNMKKSDKLMPLKVLKERMK